jgi:hypothetical protein
VHGLLICVLNILQSIAVFCVYVGVATVDTGEILFGCATMESASEIVPSCAFISIHFTSKRNDES